MYVNAAFRDRFGARSYGGVVVGGQSLFGYFTDASRERFMTVAVPALWKTGSWSGELEALNPGGVPVPLWQTAITHRGANGKPVYFSGIAHDMSQVKAAQALVQASEERFRALIAHGSDVILVAGADGRISYASPAIERVLGRRVESLIGTVAFELIHPDDLDVLLSRFMLTVSDTNDRHGMQCRASHADGSWRWVELFASNHLDEPAIGGLIINGRDITARHDADDEIRRGAALLSSVMRAAVSEAIIVTDSTSRIVAFSRGAEYLLGYTPDEVIGILHPAAFHPFEEIAAVAAELGVAPADLFVHEPPKGQSLVRE